MNCSGGAFAARAITATAFLHYFRYLLIMLQPRPIALEFKQLLHHGYRHPTGLLDAMERRVLGGL